MKYLPKVLHLLCTFLYLVGNSRSREVVSRISSEIIDKNRIGVFFFPSAGIPGFRHFTRKFYGNAPTLGFLSLSSFPFFLPFFYFNPASSRFA